MAPFAVEVAGATLVGERRDLYTSTQPGVPLILVHGFGGTRHDWDFVLQGLDIGNPTLAQSIITFDQRGFGQSRDVSETPFSYSEDLIALLDALEIEQADLCGVSLGGGTVLGCALEAPERVRNLVMISPMLAGWEWSQEWSEQWKMIGRAAQSGDRSKARDLWYSHPIFEPTRHSPQAAYLRKSIAAFHGDQWVRDHQRPKMPMVDMLHCVNARTLLLTGSLDVFDFRLMADLIEGAVEHLHRIDYKDAGHLLSLERPNEIAAAIKCFLQN